MVLDSLSRANVSPRRPSSLLLPGLSGSGSHTRQSREQDKNNNVTAEMIDIHSNIGVKRNRKKRRAADAGVKKFDELYVATGETLGEGSFGSVQTYKNVITNLEYAVKMVRKTHERSRNKVLKEIEIFHHCKGHDNILQLVEYFEEEDRFYMVFEKMEGGTLLGTIERRGHLSEQEASLVIRDIAKALSFLHKKGMAHRDLKPENILCLKAGQLVPVKICDFDLGSGMTIKSQDPSPVTTPELLTPVGSAEFMAPEVVDVWTDQAWSYDKRCDMWSLGIILYILLCGYPPFYGQCGNDCGWERGESCKTCQDTLFQRIQDGVYDFPEDEWLSVSDDARDLIRHLLVRDPHMRYSANEVLRHPWVAMESPSMPLATARVLKRNNSVKELEAFAENANAVNRLILRHISISEAFNPPSFQIGGTEESNESDPEESMFHLHDDFDEPIFQMGSDLEGSGSGSEEEDQPPILWMGLTPPGQSALARRRADSKSKDGADDEGVRQVLGNPPPNKPKARASPPKVASAIF